jgi:hypothetical protein
MFSAIKASNLLTASAFPYMPDRRLLEFDRTLEGYASSPSPGRRYVILGSSYAEALDTSYINLGLISTVPREHMHIIKKCPPADTVLYVFTLLDLFYANSPTREYVIRPPLRRLYLCKMSLLYRARLFDRVEEKPGSYHEEYRLLQYAAGRESLKDLWADRTIQLIGGLAACERVDLAPLRRLQQLHPNIIFVLHPILPLKSLPENSAFARQVNHLVTRQHELLENMQQSGLPFIDLSNEVKSEQFIDLLHVRPEAELGRKLEDALMDREFLKEPLIRAPVPAG